MDKGTVLRFFDQKGFGFIQPESGGKDLFVHINEVEGGQLQSGDVVEYEVTEGRKGPQACAPHTHDHGSSRRRLRMKAATEPGLRRSEVWG